MKRQLPGALSAVGVLALGIVVLAVTPAHGATGNLTTVIGPQGIGDGPKLSANLNEPAGVDVYNGIVYFADSRNHRIRKIEGGTITTIAGTGAAGYSGDGGNATSATLNNPRDVAVSADGNTIYVADTDNYVIRRISGGAISTIAGTGEVGYDNDIPAVDATASKLNRPVSLAIDDSGNIYVADSGNSRIRKINTSASPDTITTVVGTGTAGDSNESGPGTSSPLNYPQAVEVKSDGSVVYIADYLNNKVLALNTSLGTLSKVTGDGTPNTICAGGSAVGSKFGYPDSLALDGSKLYVNSYSSNKVCVITFGGLVPISHFAGSGVNAFSGDGGAATSASIGSVGGIAAEGDIVYIADKGNNRIRRVGSGTIDTFAGSGTWGVTTSGLSGANTRLRLPEGLAIGPTGDVYVTDMFNHRVLRLSGGTVSVVAGNSTAGSSGDGGGATSAQLNSPGGIAISPDGSIIYIADTGNNRIRKVVGGVITTIAGTGTSGYDDDILSPIAASTARLNDPRGLAVSPDGNFLYVADTMNNRIRRINLAADPDSITTIAGTGTSGYDDDATPIAALSARLNAPRDVEVSSGGTTVYVADTNNSRVRAVTGGNITTVAGGVSTFYPGLSLPTGVALDVDGNLYITDTGNYRVRRVSTTGAISSIGGSGHFGYTGENIAASTSAFGELAGIGVDSLGNVFVADRWNHRVFKIETAASAVPTTTTSTTTASAALVIPRVGGLTPKAIATSLGMATPNGARYTITVTATSKTKCAVKRSKLVSLKTGTCRFTISVKPPKGPTKKRTTTLATQ